MVISPDEKSLTLRMFYRTAALASTLNALRPIVTPLQQYLEPLFQPGVNRPVQNPVIPLA